MKCANCYDSVATMLADKLKVIETMSDEIQTLRDKVASADVLVGALRTVYSDLEKAKPSRETMTIIREALVTYDKLSEVKHDTNK